MKNVFVGSFITLILLSFVAWLWVPKPGDARVRRLEFLLDKADANRDGHVTWDETRALFLDWDRNSDGMLSRADAFGEDRLESTLDAADDDGDRRVTEEEWWSFFSHLDRNKDGVLSASDYPEQPPIELVWCSDDNPVRREQIRLFNRLYPDYYLRLDPQNAGMEKVIVQSLAGVGPDLFDCYNGYQLSAFVRAGISLDVTDALAERSIAANEVWPALQPLIVHEGRLYGFPDNAHAPAVWYNKKVFNEAGVPYPRHDWTWDECIELCQKLTQRNERGQITRYGIIGYWDWKLGLYQARATIFTPEGTRSTLDSPEAAFAMQFMQDLIHKHEVMPTPQAETAMASAGGWGSGVITLFGAGRSAMAIGGRWWLCILRDEAYAHLDLGAVEVPALSLPDGALSRRIWGGGRSTLVNATGRQPNDALCFLDFLHSRDWNELINRQADALAPVRKYNYDEIFLFNPDHPEEDYNHVWRAAMERAEAEEVSPYVNGQTVDRILVVQTDLVRANLKTGADAMRDAAGKINKAIVETLRRDPELKRQYHQALARGAQAAWDRPEDAP